MMEDAKKPFTAASLHVPEGIAFGQEVRPRSILDTQTQRRSTLNPLKFSKDHLVNNAASSLSLPRFSAVS